MKYFGAILFFNTIEVLESFTKPCSFPKASVLENGAILIEISFLKTSVACSVNSNESRSVKWVQ